MLTKESVISNAITIMGHDPIQTLDNADSLVVSAEQAYDLLLPSVIAEGNWRFAMQVQELSKLNEVPVKPWKTVYALPAGWVKTISIYPTSYEWDIFENRRIYFMFDTDSPIYMQYAFVPDVSLLPMHFVRYFVLEIAAYLALSNAEKTEFYSVLEQRRVSAQAMAMAIDAQNRPNFVFKDFPAINLRGVSGSYGFGVS